MGDFKSIKIETKSIRDVVYEAIKRAIVKGELKPGERLVEQHLSENFKVSRTPLREAIQKLESERLVTRINSGGVRVSELSEREIKEIYDIRISLESKMIREVASNWQEGDLEGLKAVVNEIKSKLLMKDYHKKTDVIKLIQTGNQFHEQLHKIYNNHTCTRLLKSFQAQIDRYAYLALSVRERAMTSAQEHLELFELIKNRQSNEAEHKMKKHILMGQEMTIEMLRKLKSEEGT